MGTPSICKAFGNPQRLKLLACLKKKHSVSDLSKGCTLSQSALSQHLKVLRDAHLVTIKRSGTTIFYVAKSKKVSALAQSLLTLKK